MIDRTISAHILNTIQKTDQIVIIYGARQVGKTTLVQSIISQLSYKTLSINADERKYIDLLSSRDFAKINTLISGYELLFIDEAQRIPDIGINIKIIHDHRPELKIILTGSSSFELASRVKEPLTGRTRTFYLYPISFEELLRVQSAFDLDSAKENLMIYGSYPAIMNQETLKEKRIYLKELCDAYLYKDILEIASIKHSKKLIDLLRLLAFQIGNLVSFSELGNALDLSKETVIRYIDLLEKSHVIFRLPGFSRNLRKEITKMDKIYFNDLGIRNVLIDNMSPFSIRNDTGALWENFIILERKKLLNNLEEFRSSYFWRTYTGAEIDYIEEKDTQLSAYEIKLTSHKSKAALSWKTTYPGSTLQVIEMTDYHEFISSISFQV